MQLIITPKKRRYKGACIYKKKKKKAKRKKYADLRFESQNDENPIAPLN